MNVLMNPITNRTHWSPLAELRREMDRLFDDFWATPSLGRVDSQWDPACEIDEEKDHYLITLEMAGIPKDQIKIELQGDQLVVSGERRHESKDKKSGAWYSERRFGKFQRTFTMPSSVDVENLEANYQDGILRLYVPKAASARPRQIKITNGSATGFFGKLLGAPKKEKEVESSSSDEKVDRVA